LLIKCVTFCGEKQKIRYIVSDCGAVGIIHDEQGYAKSAEDAVADVLHAGNSLLFFLPPV
jgi:hypothetical protein